MSIGILPDVSSALNGHFPIGRLKSNQTKKPKKDEGKSAVAIAKNARQLSCVSKDTEPPDSTTISRKGRRVLEPIRRVRFTRATLRQANIRENKGPSLNEIQVKRSDQRIPYAVKSEDRSQEETEDTSDPQQNPRKESLW